MSSVLQEPPVQHRPRGGGGPRRTVLRTQLAGVGRRPARLLLTGLAVVVAAFVVAGTVLTHGILVATTMDTFSGTSRAADLVAKADDTTAAKIAELSRLPGVTAVAPRVGSFVTAPGGEGYQVGTDPGSGELSQVKVVSGRFPTGNDEIAVTAGTAGRKGLKVGAVQTVRFGEKEAKQLTVTGIIEPAADDHNDLFMTTAGVAALDAGAERGFFRVDVALAPDADLGAVAEKVRSTLGGTVDVQTGAATREAEVRDAVEDFDEMFALIGMFVAIAVAAAALVATSTFRIVFAQRMRQLALLRAVGADRGKLTSALAVEGLVTGLVAGTVGTVAAVGVAYLAPVLFELAGRQVSAPALPVAALLATVLGATLVTVVAVLAPARSAAKVAPLQALREAAVTDGRGGIGWGRLAAGLLCLAGALGGAGLVWNSVPGPEAENYDPSYLLLGTVGSGFLAFCALMALGPVLVRPILAAIAWPARLLGPVGRLAVGGVGGAPRRAAAVSVVVGLGVTLVAGTLVGAASLQAYIDRSMAITSPTDFEVSADTTLPPAVVQQLATNPKLTRIAPYRRIEAQLDGREGVAADLKWGSVRALAQVEPAAGSFGDLRPGRAILSGWLARELKKTVGDTVTVTAGTGTAQVTVAVVLPDGAPLGASVLVDPADLDRLGVPAGPAGVLADAAQPGAAGRSAAAEVLTPLTEQGVAVQFLGEEREETLDQVAAVVWIAMGLIGLTVLIAVVGVGSTTALSVVERMRESGLLRAVGLSRRRLLATLTAEAGLYGLLGAILGIGLGIPYAWLTVYVLNIGAPLRLPLGQLITVAVILALVTALAGVLPARRAAKVSPVTALGSAE